MIATGPTQADVAREVERVRGQIAYYGHFPEYLPVWAAHGWESSGHRLQELASSNRWPQMPEAVTEEMVHTFAAVGTYEEIGDRIVRRFGSFATRIALPLPEPAHEDLLAPSIRQLQNAVPSRI